MMNRKIEYYIKKQNFQKWKLQYLKWKKKLHKINRIDSKEEKLNELADIVIESKQIRKHTEKRNSG